MKTYSLKDGNKIPALGFGTWELKGKTARRSVEYALEIGYRHIDTADIYGNHKQVAKAINDSGIKREDLFITTKVWKSDLLKENVIDAGKIFLDELQTDYVDLLLIHWPNSNVPVEETLEGFMQLKQEGVTRSIGVSNFTVSHLEEALDKSDAQIVNNQIEYHPSLDQHEIEKYCKEKGIVITAYSPLGKGKDLKINVIKEIAEKKDKPASQVLINWILQKNLVAIPRSSSKEHIKENFEAINWELDEDDMRKINEISGNNRIVDPGFAEF